MLSNFKKLPDVQNAEDRRGITINKVGVTDIDHPMFIQSKSGQAILVYAKINLFTSLLHNIKGTNMSRYMEVVSRWENKTLTPLNFKDLLTEVRDVAHSMDAYAEIHFPLFLKKETPVTKMSTSSAYNCLMIGHVDRKGNYKCYLGVIVLVTSVCPCSKEMSLVDRNKRIGKGAHNQRSEVTVTVEMDPNNPLWFEDIIPIVEREGSCEIFNLLKRPDEKFVTEKAYENPKFVEDIARDVARALQSCQGIKWFKVKVKSFESIHKHNACAYVERVKKGFRWIKCGKTLRK